MLPKSKGWSKQLNRIRADHVSKNKKTCVQKKRQDEHGAKKNKAPECHLTKKHM
jgi:hypothetical protein